MTGNKRVREETGLTDLSGPSNLQVPWVTRLSEHGNQKRGEGRGAWENEVGALNIHERS